MIRYAGEGTETSPIAIEDDSDDDIIEIQPIPAPVQLEIARQTSPVAQYTTDYSENPKKRKNYADEENATPETTSFATTTKPSLENRLSQPETKKERKKRRKLEKRTEEEQRIRDLNWLNGIARSPSGRPLPLPTTNPGVSVPFTFMPSHRTSAPPSPVLDEPVYLPSHSHSLRFDGGLQQSDVPMSHLPSSQSAVAQPDDRHMHSEPVSVHSGLNPLANEFLPTTTTTASDSHSFPSKPTTLASPTPIIGMLPDLDPSSKHGTFDGFECFEDFGTGPFKHDAKYYPDPARTLVLEMLPKVYRHADYVREWALTACGTFPLHLFIDVARGRALVEFVDASLAQRAWQSPKLGLALLQLKSHQLKGKPREDQIKAWWFKPQTSFAKERDQGELEEGEIADPAVASGASAMVAPLHSGGFPPPAQPHQETKKQRKARLARERAERLQSEQQQRDITVFGNVLAAFGPSALPSSFPSMLPPWSAPNFSPLPTPDSMFFPPSFPVVDQMQWQASQPLMGNFPFGMNSDLPTAPKAHPSLPRRPPTFISQNIPNDVEANFHSVESKVPTPSSAYSNQGDVSGGGKVVAANHHVSLSLDPVRVSRQSSTASIGQVVELRPFRLQLTCCDSSGRKSSIESPHDDPPSLLQTTTLPHAPPSHKTLEKSQEYPATLPPAPVKESMHTTHMLPNGDQSESIKTQSAMLRERLLAQKLAREKERAEMLRTSLHLGEPAGEPHRPPVLVPSRSGFDDLHTAPSQSPNQAMEDRLRNLVLKTKKSRQPGLETPSAGSSSSSTPLLSTVKPSPSQSSTTTPSATEHADDLLDNLAVSVIEQAIETAKAQHGAPKPPLRSSAHLSVATQNTLPMNGQVPIDAAAKVAQLEENIKETKRLMAMIQAAPSKQEKDALLQRLREITQTSTPHQRALTTKKTTDTRELFRPHRWPAAEEQNILILSDDESDEGTDD